MEAEVFINIRAWKNFPEMEESLTLPELNLLIGKIREEKKDYNVFIASLQGVDLNKYYSNPVEVKRKEIEKRAAERTLGKDGYERQEFAEFGIDFASD